MVARTRLKTLSERWISIGGVDGAEREGGMRGMVWLRREERRGVGKGEDRVGSVSQSPLKEGDAGEWCRGRGLR